MIGEIRMSYEKMKALLNLADKKGLNLNTVADFHKFANENYTIVG